MNRSYLSPLRILRPFETLKPFFKANWWALLIGVMSLLVVDLLQLFIPLVIKKAVDLLTTGIATRALLLRQGAIIVALALMIGLFRYIWRYLIFGHSRKVEEGLRNILYAHLQTLSPSFYHRTKTGDLMARAINDINAIRMATGMGMVALTDGLILGMAAIGFMISINIKLTLISLIPAPIVVILTRILTRRMSSGFERVQKQFSELTERVREGFAGIWVIKAFDREQWQYGRVKEEGQRYLHENLGLAKTLAFFFPMMAIFTNTGLAIVIWLGGRLTIFGQITTGDFVAFTSYLNLLTWPMMAMGWVTNLLQRASASMKRINIILEKEPEIKDTPTPIVPKSLKGKITVADLYFRYPGRSSLALKGISLQIHPAETIAIVGRVGCGKTTLLMAMVRMLNIPEGVLFIDDMDIHHLSLEALRKHMGFVPQQTMLFSDTVRNNILMGRTDISDEQVHVALEIAAIADEVNALEAGIDTILGERGATLSGGQRQRLAIARAIVSNPPILILDDAFSMVDMQTETQILTRLLEFRASKTTIVVSHRTSTLARADRIVVMDNGEIVEVGTHHNLLKNGTLYKKLYEERRLTEELKMM